jgi:N utilization substance protein A
VVAVRKGLKGPSIQLSRTHPGLVRKLFALEAPEVADGSVEIVAIAREAGHRTKIAVRATRPGINAKGACIGPMGQRVRSVVSELHGEKIDIIEHIDDPAAFVAAALSPAKVDSVEIVDLAGRAARVVVPDYQLSLAIGKEGQNARLAAKLTGWRIDIRPDVEPSAVVGGRNRPASTSEVEPSAVAGGRNRPASTSKVEPSAVAGGRNRPAPTSEVEAPAVADLRDRPAPAGGARA